MIAGENDESVFQLAASLERSKHPAWPFVTTRMFSSSFEFVQNPKAEPRETNDFIATPFIGMPRPPYSGGVDSRLAAAEIHQENNSAVPAFAPSRIDARREIGVENSRDFLLIEKRREKRAKPTQRESGPQMDRPAFAETV